MESVAETARAAALLHPLRIEILGRARTPKSATEIAADLGESRQKVNYHVKELAKAGLLRDAGRRRKRNLIEQRYVATARSYVLAPELLGALQVDERALADRFGSAYLIALAARLSGEVQRAEREARSSGKRLATFALDAEVRFESAAQRAAFGAALEEAVERVVREHSSPARTSDGAGAPGRPYRLVIGCAPIPPDKT